MNHNKFQVNPGDTHPVFHNKASENSYREERMAEARKNEEKEKEHRIDLEKEAKICSLCGVGLVGDGQQCGFCTKLCVSAD